MLFLDRMNRIYLDRMNRIYRILILLLFFSSSTVLAQTNIRISFENQQDSVFYFCKYRGSKTIIIDTLLSKNSQIQIKFKEKLPEGIYLLTNANNYPMTEILIGKDQRYSVKINNLDDLNSFKVKGDKESAIYFKLMAKVRQYDLMTTALDSETEYFPDNVRKIDSLKKDLDEYENSLKIKRKDAFINLVITSMKRHTMDDYWDDFPLDDARILTYPLIDNKLETYFDNLYNDAEKINSEIDKLIAKTGNCIKVRDYLIWFFYRKYYAPKYMNLDDVYIHLVNEYFAKFKMENVSESIVNLMTERANYLENLKIGSKLPNIGNLHSIDAEYITVVFYDKTCKKCAQEGRILEEIHARHPEMMIFPVEVNSTSIKNLMVLYDIQTTPTIYLLDNQKKIIAKRIKAEQVEQFLNMD